jgi:hypothetical protein
MFRAWLVRTQSIRNTVGKTSHFALLVLGAVFANKLAEFASHVISSKFVVYVVLFLEYALVLSDGYVFLRHRIGEIWESPK